MLRNSAGLILIVVFLACAFVYGRIIIEGDGFTYYAMTQSLVEDGDLQLRNQRQLPDLHLFVSPVNHKIASRFSCGFAFLYAPYLIAAESFEKLVPSSASWKPYPQNNFIPFVHSLAIFAGTVAFSLGTIFFCILLLKHAGSEPATTVLLTLLVFVGTPLLFYTFTMPAYTHAADSFLFAAAFLLVVATRKNLALRNMLIGFVLSLAVVLRNHNIALISPIVIGAAYLQPDRTFRGVLLTLLQVLAGAAPGIILLTCFNITQYGSLFATGYRVQTAETFLSEMLFHPDAGIFVWSPLAAAALAGLVLGTIRRKPEAVIALSCVVLAFVTIQFQPNWWGGCSFGPRLFTHLAVFWLWGLWECARVARKSTIILTAFCAAWTFFLLNIFFINAASQDFREQLRANQCRRSPAQMIGHARDDYSSAVQRGEASNPLQFWFEALGKGKFPTVLYILRH